MKQDILKYIQNEKDISRYHISTLERSKDLSLYKKRILNIEQEFVALPLEDLSFEDVADVAAAISIYRMSRKIFYETYNLEPPQVVFDKLKYFEKLTMKQNFIKSVGYDYLNVKPQEINPVQDSNFHLELANRQSEKNNTKLNLERRRLSKLTSSELLKLEPSILSRKRARLQIALYAIGKYLLESIKDVELHESLSLEALRESEKMMDNIILMISKKMFQYYNDGIVHLPAILDQTMGENAYVSKTHTLQNVLDFSEFKRFDSSPKPLFNSKNFSYTQPVFGNILYGAKKAIVTTSTRDAERKIQNKVFGVLLPIPRKGNEKMSLYYKEIIIDGVNVSHLFSNNISNIKALKGNKEIYFKALLMEPMWKVINMSVTDNISRHLLTKIMGLNEDGYQVVNFDNKSFINQINNSNSVFFPIDNDSLVLTPRTRSEEEGLLEVVSVIEKRIIEISNDYAGLAHSANEFFLD